MDSHPSNIDGDQWNINPIFQPNYLYRPSINTLSAAHGILKHQTIKYYLSKIKKKEIEKRPKIFQRMRILGLRSGRERDLLLSFEKLFQSQIWCKLGDCGLFPCPIYTMKYLLEMDNPTTERIPLRANATDIDSVNVNNEHPIGHHSGHLSELDPIDTISSKCIKATITDSDSESDTESRDDMDTTSLVYVAEAADVVRTFKSIVPHISTQEDIDDALGHPLSYQFMFDKRTSPWEMSDWDEEKLQYFVIETSKIDRLYHITANDSDPNFRQWELCCRMHHEGEKYFVEMYANCDYTGFDCQGGGFISLTKLPSFFLENMVTIDQDPDRIYHSLKDDGYEVIKPDFLHKMHPKAWTNPPMLKYLCHLHVYDHKDTLGHYKDVLPTIIAKSVDEFIIVKEWENE